MTPIMVPFNLRDLDNSGPHVHTRVPKKASLSPKQGEEGAGGAAEGWWGIGAVKPSIAKGFRSCVNPLQPVASTTDYKGLGGLSAS